MVHVTDNALKKLDEMRKMGGLAEDQLIGIGVGEQGMLRFDVMNPDADDQVIEKDGTPVMVVPAILADPLDNAVLDYHDDDDERRFTLREAAPETAGETGA
jgi:Fe-S cluster assembly iron-binding protein IscA